MHRPEPALAAQPHHDRKPAGGELIEPGEQFEIVVFGLAEAEPRVDPHLRTTGRLSRLGPFGQIAGNFFDHVVIRWIELHVPGRPAHVQRHVPNAELAGQRAEPGRDVVDQGGTLVDRSLRGLCVPGVDRDAPQMADRCDRRDHPVDLVGDRHRLGPGAGNTSTVARWSLEPNR